MTPLDILIPVYNEELAVVHNTIDQLVQAFAKWPQARIIVIDDGSDSSYGLAALADDVRITFVQHERNQGYGAALKTGVLTGIAPWIAIGDADGTYPLKELPKLASYMTDFDMVVGTRTGAVRQIPWLRRFPKRMLNLFASYMARTPICDLNSGMRVFSRELVLYLWPFFPQGFSFTSTLTMGALMGGFRTKEVSINYFKRHGNSSIAPIKDTIRFFRIVCRLGLIFYPTRLFGPVASVLFFGGFIKGIFRDYIFAGYIGNFSQLAMIAGIQVFMLGLICRLIVLNRAFLYGFRKPKLEQPQSPVTQTQRANANVAHMGSLVQG